MAPIKCSVCGGTVINGRCSECGMTFTDESRRYHLNESREDHYKHATREIKREIESYSQNTQKPQKSGNTRQGGQNWQQKGRTQSPGTTTTRTGKKFGLTMIVPLMIFFIIFINIMSAIMSFTNSVKDEADNWEFEPNYPDIPEVPTVPEIPELDMDGDKEVQIEDERVMTDGGGDEACVLEPGYYLVGAHIPEGTYTVETIGGDEEEAVMSVRFLTYEQDNAKNLDYSLSADGELLPERLLGVKLFAGTIVEVQGNGQRGQLLMSADDAHFDEKQWQTVANPIEGACYFTDSVTAGVDFEAGIYDIKVPQGAATLEISGEGIDKKLFMAAWDETWQDCCRNLYLSEGTVITVQEPQPEFQFVLIPSGEYYEDYSEAWTKLFGPRSGE